MSNPFITLNFAAHFVKDKDLPFMARIRKYLLIANYPKAEIKVTIIGKSQEFVVRGLWGSIRMER